MNPFLESKRKKSVVRESLGGSEITGVGVMTLRRATGYFGWGGQAEIPKRTN
jgi:hypothetical protein